MLLFVYSLSGIFSKLAAGESLLSFNFCLYYACIVAILGIYAIGWQQIIKRMPLTTAYANKAVCTIWGSVWGILIFKEQINFEKIVGIVMIVVGIVLFSTEKDENDG